MSIRKKLAALAEIPGQAPSGSPAAKTPPSSANTPRTAVQAVLVNLGYPDGQCAATPWGISAWQILVPAADGTPVVFEELVDPDAVDLLRLALTLDTQYPSGVDRRSITAIERAARHLCRARIASAAATRTWEEAAPAQSHELADHALAERTASRALTARVRERLAADTRRSAEAQAEATLGSTTRPVVPVTSEAPAPTPRHIVDTWQPTYRDGTPAS